MTESTTHHTQEKSVTATHHRQQSHILEELWAVKAQLNADAGYDLDRLIEIVRKEAAPYFDKNDRVCIPAGMTSAAARARQTAA
jgi:hypothetical protein